MRCWGIVPARGGSKSIPGKNLVPLAGRPLLDYGVRAAQESGVLERIICSTDDEHIAGRAEALGIETDARPAHLSGDDARVEAAIADYLARMKAEGRTLPEAVVLIQPTSPFLLPRHVVDLVDLLSRHDEANSAHNVGKVPHNLHAWNQRLVDSHGRVEFLFRKEREGARNKQEKPAFMTFGNLVMARTGALLKAAGFYAEPSIAMEIPAPHQFDLDGPEDLCVAEALLSMGAVKLPHLPGLEDVQTGNQRKLQT
jgi:CMP-N-acetylneuraminic acid synthetase